jgi:tetraacyldisaccharide 4'-kinase
VARHLEGRGLRVAVLSRGYKSRGDGVRVVSTGRAGEGPLLGPRVAGDEPVLLAGELPGVAVLVCPDRAAAGRRAMAHLDPPPDVFVLDDGFSHVRLARDLDLLAVPAADPFGGGRLAPGGRLREPLESAAAADAVVLTGPEEQVRGLGTELARELARFGFHGEGFAAPIRPLPARTAAGDPVPAGTRVLLVSGVARPDGVRRAAEAVGLRVAAEIRFGDHHAYPESSLRKIADSFRDTGVQAVATTSKDRVKLHGRLQDSLVEIPLVEIPVVCEPEPELFVWLERRLERRLERGIGAAP